MSFSSAVVRCLARPGFLLPLATVVSALVVLAGSAAAAEAKRPNFVFLLVDDLRYDALGCMGDKIVKTPAIDRLAADGVLFENCFVTTSICWVSRTSIFTGQWMRRHGIENSAPGLQDQAWDNTYPALLRAAGYRTGFVGKFGVGNAREVEAKASQFDFFRGLPGQAGQLFIDPEDPKRRHKTAQFGDEALEFLSGCTAEQPFCLSVSFNAVHARDGKPREFEPDPRDESLYQDVTIPVSQLATDEAYRRLPESVQNSEGRRRWGWRYDTPEKMQRILRDYYRLISGVDREVGRIRQELAHRGLADRTVIIFTADNGFALGDRGMADKWYMYEEDIRVPAIIYDPLLPESRRGKRVEAMALNVDFAPTMLELAGVKAPQQMQGRSLLPVLEGQTPSDWRTEFFYEHHSVANRIPPSEGVRTERFKLIRWINEEPVIEELYDLANDPLEEQNLVSDPKYADTLAELRGKWQRYQESLK
jgi:arylsulfatase A-like enzyme